MMLPKLNLRLAHLSASTLALTATRTNKSLPFKSSAAAAESSTRTAAATDACTSATSPSLSSTPTPSSTFARTRLSSCLTYPLVLLSLLLLLVLHPVVCKAERDFNFNDSQVPLLEPKDEPILIEGHHHIATTTATNSTHQQHNHHHHHAHQDPYAMELSYCRYGDNELLLSLVLKNYNWHDVSPSRREKVLEKLSKFFAIPKEFIAMEGVSKHELSEMQKESLKKGTNKCHTNITNNRKLGRVNFIIGCHSTYFKITEPIAKQIGQQFKDGAIDNITGEKFGWWVIWRKQHKTRSMRNRRQAEGSGINDNDDYEDDNDYEYDDDEEIIEPQQTKQTTTPSKTDSSNKQSNAEDENELLNSNTLEHVTRMETLKSHGRDDITALKQTDADTNIEEDQKSDSNLLLLNKKGLIDEEIVESVSELESVITKTIENTKNIEDIPERVVEQPEEELLKQVLHQPTQTLEETKVSKNSEHLNLNSLYETPLSEDDLSTDISAITPTSLPQMHHYTTTTTTTNTATVNQLNNKDNHFENALGHNMERLRHHTAEHTLQHHPSSSNTDTELAPLSTTTITLLPPPPPIILTDSNTLTLTTPNEYTAIDMPSIMTSSSYPASMSGSVVTTATSASKTAPTTTTTTSSITATGNKVPYSSNKMIKVDFNKYEDEKDEDDDDDDDGDGGNAVAHDKTDIDANNNIVYNGKYESLTTIMPPSHHSSNLTPSTSSSSSSGSGSGSASASTMRHTVATTPATHHQHYKGDDFKVRAGNHMPTHGTPYHHYYGFPSSSSSSGRNNDYVMATTTTLPYEVLAPLVTTTLATPLTDEEVLPPFEQIDTGKKEYYDTTFDAEDDQDATSSKASSSTTPQTAADENTSPLSSTTQPPITTQVAVSPSASPSSTTTTTTSTTSTTTTTESPSSTTAMPDYIEPKIENTPPLIKARLQKLAVTSGKQFKFTVPEETFYDSEDMSNLRLELTDKEGRELKTNSWLQFNGETKEIYGLPLDDAVSKWQYRLTATDSGNESVTETMEISVQQHRGVRTVNHEINIAVKINEKNLHYIDWQLQLINGIATTLGDDNTNSIVVREVRQNPQDPSSATLVYFNETLPTTECPESELNNLVKRLDANRLSELVQPTLGIKSITGQLIGSCQKTVTVRPKPTVTKNSNPVPRNQVDRVVATAGHLLVYKVPWDTFFDPNGNKLVLSLKTKDHKDLSPRHWLQFDSKNDEFYGIPKAGDYGSEEYLLVAEGAGGLTATDALVVTVNPSPKREFSVYYKAHLAIRHEQFNADLQRKFVERIAQLFGDATTQNIQIRSINTMHDSDGTTVNFYNTTLFKSHNRCPEEEMEAVRNVYLQDNVMRERVKRLLGPELNITNLQVNVVYTCNPHGDIMRPDFVPNKTEEPTLKSTFSEDYLYTIILPAVIIVTMILVASIIACCLHRRRRKSGKMELGDEEERKSFRTKGIPVIFQDELDEKPEIGNKSPIILKDEKPPLLPPSYNTSNMNGDNDVDEYVPPPAVVVGGREARGKSPATPSYRKPPPYVSP